MHPKINFSFIYFLVSLTVILNFTELNAQSVNCQILYQNLPPIRKLPQIDLSKIYTSLAKQNLLLSQRSRDLSDLNSWREGGLCGPTCVANIHSAIQVGTQYKTQVEAVTSSSDTLRNVVKSIDRTYGGNAAGGTSFPQLQFALDNLFKHTEIYELVEVSKIDPKSKDWVNSTGVLHLVGVQNGKNQGHAIIVVRVIKKGNKLEAIISDPERPNILVSEKLIWNEVTKSYSFSRYGNLIEIAQVKASSDL